MRITVKRTEEVPDSELDLSGDAPMEVVESIREFKKTHRGVTSVEISEDAMSKLYNTFISRDFAGTGENLRLLLTERMRDQYYSTGEIHGFMGLNWYPIAEQEKPKIEVRHIDEHHIVVTECSGEPGKVGSRQTSTFYVSEEHAAQRG